MTDDPRPVNPYGVGYALTGLDPPIHHQLSRPGHHARLRRHVEPSPMRASSVSSVDQ